MRYFIRINTDIHVRLDLKKEHYGVAEARRDWTGPCSLVVGKLKDHASTYLSYQQSSSYCNVHLATTSFLRATTTILSTYIFFSYKYPSVLVSKIEDSENKLYLLNIEKILRFTSTCRELPSDKRRLRHTLALLKLSHSNLKSSLRELASMTSVELLQVYSSLALSIFVLLEPPYYCLYISGS